MPPKKVKEAGPAGVRKYSEKMKMVTQGAEERDNKAQQVLREARETRQVVEQASKQGGLMQVPFYPANHHFSSMPDLTAIMPSHQNITSYSGGGVVEIVQQQQAPRPCSVIVSPHEGGGALRRAKSFSRPRSTSPNPAVLRPTSPGRPCAGRPVSLEQRDKQKLPTAVSSQFAGQRNSLPCNFEARRTEVFLPAAAYHQNTSFNDGSIQNNFNSSPVTVSNNPFNISAQDNHNNLSNFNSSLSTEGISSSHQLCLRRQTEGDIFNSRLTHQPESERKFSEPASPIRIMISSPEDDHLQQQQRSSNPTKPVTSHLFGGYRSRRNSDNPHSPGPSTPGTPGSPESDFNSNPNSPQSECHHTDELSKILNDLTSTYVLETPTATLVSQPESSVYMDQLPPDSDQAVYTILSAPPTGDQISRDGAQLVNGNSAILQIQEFEEFEKGFNMLQPQ